MRMTTTAKVVMLSAAVVLLLGSASGASAGTITLSHCISGPNCGAYLGGPVTLTLSDVTGGVEFTIDNATNGDVTEVDLLFGGTVFNSGKVTLTPGAAPSFNAYSLNALNGAEMQTFTFASVFTDAGLQFNVKIDLPPPMGGSPYRLNPGESLRFAIEGLEAAEFQNAMAHVQSMGNCTGLPNCGGSVKLTVPDGGTTLVLLGGALVGLAALRRRFSA